MSRVPACCSDVDAGRAVIVERPGLGTKVDNVEFLACSTDTPRFNLDIVTVEPHHDGPDPHVHEDEDHPFFVLEVGSPFGRPRNAGRTSWHVRAGTSSLGAHVRQPRRCVGPHAEHARAVWCRPLARSGPTRADRAARTERPIGDTS
jgi:hypothetical protein